MQDFMTPPKHVNFHAKKLFGEMGRIVDGSVAYIELNGGGPTELHTHEHNHLFIVTEGEARIFNSVKVKYSDGQVLFGGKATVRIEGDYLL